MIKAWLRIEAVRVAIGVNTWEGVEYVDRDRFEAFLGWAVRLDRIESDDPAVVAASVRTAARLSAKAKAAGYRVDRLGTGPRSGTGRKRAPRPGSTG